MIYNKLLETAVPLMKGLTLKDVRVGIGYTVVENSAGGLGLAYTLRENLGCGCSQFSGAGTLIGRELSEVAALFGNRDNVLKSGIGLAAINSVSPGGNGSTAEGDVTKVMDIRPGEWVGMIGHFAPLEREIRKITPHLFIIDNGKGYLHNTEFRVIQEILAGCKVVIISATTLINKSLEDVLDACENARTRILLGPSTPLYPEVFKGKVQVLAGMIPKNRTQVMEIVSQGGGTLHFKKHSRKVNIVLNGNGK